MEPDYILACGIAWRKTSDPAAGSELVDGLQSEDHEIRSLAQRVLAESGEASMSLLESALAAGMVTPESAGPCMAAILRSQNAIGDWGNRHRTQN